MPSKSKARRPDRLIVLSNRLPYNLPRDPSERRPKRNVGGLVNALEPVLSARDGIWIGWDGISHSSASAVSSSIANPRTFRTESGVDLFGVPISEREIGRYYHGFSNRALWPLFHDRLSLSVFSPDDYAAYVRVNSRFAETALSHAKANDRIWIHDYHLMLVPTFLREMGFRGRVDFFLHIPFPPPEIFKPLPWREQLLNGLLAADAVAFHVRGYRDNFVRAAEEIVGARPSQVGGGTEWHLEHPGGRTVAGVAPIGVEVDEFERIAELPAVKARAERFSSAHGGRRIIFSADRLDYSKGIRERFLALERFMASHPDLAGTFDFVQIVVPSRHQVEEYRALKRAIDQEAGRINAQYAREDWVPIRYVYRALGRDELVAHYRAAAIALVTPLKDGMNLVAPEFVASRTDGDGVLVVSEFAGVAEQLSGAILVNPYDYDGCASAIANALEMGEDERRARMSTLRAEVRSNPVSVWADRCLGLGTTQRLQPARRPNGSTRPPLARRSFLEL
jgi:trehalose 6-phosphate synthase